MKHKTVCLYFAPFLFTMISAPGPALGKSSECRLYLQREAVDSQIGLSQRGFKDLKRKGYRDEGVLFSRVAKNRSIDQQIESYPKVVDRSRVQGGELVLMYEAKKLSSGWHVRMQLYSHHAGELALKGTTDAVHRSLHQAQANALDALPSCGKKPESTAIIDQLPAGDEDGPPESRPNRNESPEAGRRAEIPFSMTEARCPR